MTTQRASFMRRTVTMLKAVALLAGIMAIAALPAGAKVRGSNGRIVFGRFDPAVGDLSIGSDGRDKSVPYFAACSLTEPALVT